MPRRGTQAQSIERVTLLSGINGRYVSALIVLSLLVRLIPAALVYGADDMTNWHTVARTMLDGRNPYATGHLNWPPLWPGLIYFSVLLAALLRLPSPFALKLLPIAADVAIVLALYGWFRRSADAPTAYRRALWYALNPVAIYTSALHGQFDSLPALFSLLAVMTAAHAPSGSLPLGAAAWLSLGGFAKTWPLLLVPAFLRDAGPLWRRILFAVAALSLAVISVGALYAAAPETIARHILRYRGQVGWWGLTTPFSAMSPESGALLAQAAPWLFYAALLCVYGVAWRRGSLPQAACLVILTFYVFASGFGTQYMVWIVPLALLAEDPRLRAYTLLATLMLTLECIARPYNGTFFQFLGSPEQRTPAFLAAYGQRRDMLLTCLDRLPLWLFCIGWWLALLRTILSAPRPFAAKSEERDVLK